MASTSAFYTITLSEEGVVHCFGHTEEGELSLVGNNDLNTIPISISSLPIIYQIACGYNFTFCVDHEGYLW